MKEPKQIKQYHSDEALRITIVEKTIVNIDKTLERMEKRFDKIDERFIKIDEQFATLRLEINGFGNKLHNLEKWMYRSFIGVMGSAIIGLLSIITTIILKKAGV